MSFAARVSAALDGIPAKLVARVAGATPKAAERWKAGDNAPGAEALCRLCAEFDSVWAVVREQAHRTPEDAEAILDELSARLAHRRRHADT